MTDSMHAHAIDWCLLLFIIPALFLAAGFEPFQSEKQKLKMSNERLQSEDESAIISKSVAMAVSMFSGYSAISNNALRIRSVRKDEKINVFLIPIDRRERNNQLTNTLAEVEILWRNNAISALEIKSVYSPLCPAMQNVSANKTIEPPIVASVNLLGHSSILSSDFVLEWQVGEQGESVNVVALHYPFSPGRHTMVSVVERKISMYRGH